jgi:hypothetical protein
MRKDKDMNLLLKFLGRQLANSYNDVLIDMTDGYKCNGFEIIDKQLSFAFAGITPSGIESLLQNMDAGTLKDWIILNKNVPLEWQNIDYDNLVKNYQSPAAPFWLWVRRLPDIQRDYFVITVLKVYCKGIVNPIVIGNSSKYREEYEKNKMYYERILKDWLPLLSQKEGESAILKKQLEQVRSK